MTTTSGPIAGPSIAVTENDWWVYNRTAATVLAVGDFLVFDEAGTSAHASTERNTGGPWGNVILPATANIGTATAHPGYGGCVVIDIGLGNVAAGLTPGAVGTLVKVRVRGMVKAKITASQDLVFGDRLGGVNAATTLSETAATGLKIYAKAAEEIASAVAGTLYWVYLEGITGHGTELA